MKTNRILYILPIALGLVACEPEFEDIDFNDGSADFTSFVTVGNSLTAGFQSNALRREKQEVSLSAMLAGQLKLVGSGEFKQPLMDPGVGLGPAGNAEFGLFIKQGCDPSRPPSLSPGPIAPQGQLDQLAPSNFIGSNGPFNNIGVPGARLSNLNQVGYGSSQGNPYFARFASNPGETMIQAAMRNNPTFFELWIGNNDVLGYSTSGGDEGGDAMTDPTTFANDFNKVLDSLRKGGAQGVIANIPYVTSIPYFTTVKWNALVLTQAQANLLNGAFAAYNGALGVPSIAGQLTQPNEVNKRKITFQAGPNGFLTLDNDLSTAFVDTMGNQLPKYRQLTAGELVTLTISQDAIRCSGLGSVNTTVNPPQPNPITGEFILDTDEVASINARVDDFNDIIKSEASARGLAFVDANKRLRELASAGITISGITFTDEFVSGGAFSLDGVHPSTRGYAIIANDFIKAINGKYNANVPQVDVASYPALEVGQ